jgi:hypothetical protein
VSVCWWRSFTVYALSYFCCRGCILFLFFGLYVINSLSCCRIGYCWIGSGFSGNPSVIPPHNTFTYSSSITGFRIAVSCASLIQSASRNFLKSFVILCSYCCLCVSSHLVSGGFQLSLLSTYFHFLRAWNISHPHFLMYHSINIRSSPQIMKLPH